MVANVGRSVSKYVHKT